MNVYEETKFLMKKYNISANKELGQNFLIDDSAINNIVEAAQISKNDFVIEIGPGLGTLTSRLVEKAGKVIAIELDKKMLQILEDRFKLYDNFSVINEDILKVELNDLIKKENTENYMVKIVANLPYYITTPIIMKLLEEKLNINSITVMVQKEVADRLTEIPGGKNTGAITYCVYYYAQAQEVLTVPNTSFIPEPKVNSEVIKLNIRKKTPVELKDEKIFFKVIKASFMQRRKTLSNALINNKILENREEVEKMFKTLEIDSNVRGEKLTLEEFGKITNYVYKR